MVGWGSLGTNFQLLMVSLNLIKFQILFMVKGRIGNQLPTFDTEPKSAKLPSPFMVEGGAVGTKFQLLIVSPNQV